MTEPYCDALDLLACPADGGDVWLFDGELRCAEGHTYPIVEGVPVMLRENVNQTIGSALRSLMLAREWRSGRRDDPMFVETLGLDDQERANVRAAQAVGEGAVDPVISFLVAATNGILYKPLSGRLDRLPIPELRLPGAKGERLLDVGCGWGRWSMASARKGYRPVGVDPSLGAVLAAKRLAGKLGLSFEGVVGDARHLPIKHGAIDTVFSYSVLQHFSKPDARQAFSEIARVTRPGGSVKVQMASCTGIRSIQNILRRGGRTPEDFDVRYWSPWALRREFMRAFGSTKLEVDCFFGLGLQASDISILPSSARVLVRVSEVLRWASGVVRPLVYVADSVYLSALNSIRTM